MNSSAMSSLMTHELVQVGHTKRRTNCTQVRKMVATIINSALSTERGNLAQLMKHDINTQKKNYDLSQIDCHAARMSNIVGKMVQQQRVTADDLQEEVACKSYKIQIKLPCKIRY